MYNVYLYFSSGLYMYLLFWINTRKFIQYKYKKSARHEEMTGSSTGINSY